MRSNYEMKLSKNHTMPIDGFREYGTNSNLLVIGSSGTGKTMNTVLPMLLDGFKEEPITFVVQDCKGLLYKNLSKKFLDEGYDVKVLDFVNPRFSNRFEPLAYARTLDDFRKIISPLVVPQVRSSRDQYWELEATNLLSNLAKFIKDNFYKNFLNLRFLNIFLGWFAEDYFKIKNAKDMSTIADAKLDRMLTPHIKENVKDKTYVKFYLKIKKLLKQSNCPDYLKNLNTYFTYPDGTFNSIVAVAKGAMSICSSDDIKNIISWDDEMKLDQLVNTKTIIFVNPSDTSRIYDPLVGLFYNMCVQKVVKGADECKNGRLTYPFRFIIDDFASGAKIEDFDKIISNIRSRNISCTLLMQSTNQLESIYSRSEAETIVANCSTQLYLGSNDFEQELLISRRLNLGYEKVHKLDRKKIIIIEENKEPIIDDKYDFKNHPNFKLSGIYDDKLCLGFTQISMYKNKNFEIENKEKSL